MDYHLSSDDLVHHPRHMQMPNVMEVVPTSDDEAPASPSTPGSGRRYMSNGRAMSSPNIGNINADGASMSAADKKRNKLGYHRTAVACGKHVFFILLQASDRKSRALSETENPLHPGSRRHKWSMLQLHSLEKRMPILSSRST